MKNGRMQRMNHMSNYLPKCLLVTPSTKPVTEDLLESNTFCAKRNTFRNFVVIPHMASWSDSHFGRCTKLLTWEKSQLPCPRHQGMCAGISYCRHANLLSADGNLSGFEIIKITALVQQNLWIMVAFTNQVM